jgi:hypothetical protein
MVAQKINWWTVFISIVLDVALAITASVLFGVIISNLGYSVQFLFWIGAVLSLCSMIKFFINIKSIYKNTKSKVYSVAGLLVIGLLINISTLYICLYCLMLSIGALGVD